MLNTTGNHRKSFWLALASFLTLVILMVSTNPIDKIIYAVVFFVLALVFMISFGFFFIGLQKATVGTKDRFRIIAIGLIVLTLLMFRSAQSLNWVDALILVLICFGLGFYISRRA
jgi:hypothetical protein